MKKMISMKMIAMTLICVCTLAAVLSGCADSRQPENPESRSSGSDPAANSDESAADTDNTQESQLVEDETAEQYDKEEETMDRKMTVEVDGSLFTATLENNEAVDTLVEMMRKEPVTIQMSDYAGFEKVGDLGTDLPTSSRQMTTQAGDIVLYQGDQIAIFYGSNSWSYTRLGKIDDLTGWADALGAGDVTVTFSLEE